MRRAADCGQINILMLHRLRCILQMRAIVIVAVFNLLRLSMQNAKTDMRRLGVGLHLPVRMRTEQLQRYKNAADQPD